MAGSRCEDDLEEKLAKVEMKMPGIGKLLESYNKQATFIEPRTQLTGTVNNIVYAETEEYFLVAAKWSERAFQEKNAPKTKEETSWKDWITIYYVQKDASKRKVNATEKKINRFELGKVYTSPCRTEDGHHIRNPELSMKLLSGNRLQLYWTSGPTFDVQLGKKPTYTLIK